MTVQEFRLPSLAESVVEGEVLGWLVAEGDTVTAGQSVLEVMTDKVTVELPSPYAGRVTHLLAQVGQIVAVGGPLALIETAVQEKAVPVETQPVPVVVLPLPPAQEASAGLKEERSIIESSSARVEDPELLAAVFADFRRVPPAAVPVASARVLAVPSARQLARQQGVALEDVRGSGPNGAVRQADVAAHLGRSEPVVPAPATPLIGKPTSAWPPPPPPNYRTPAGAEGLETRTPFRGARRAI